MTLTFRYPKISEFEADWLAEIRQTHPKIRHAMLPVRSITRNRFDRGQANRAKLACEVDDLRVRILESGRFDAILVARHLESGRWIVIDGHHRLAVAKQLGLKDVPVVMMEPLGWRD